MIDFGSVIGKSILKGGSAAISALAKEVGFGGQTSTSGSSDFTVDTPKEVEEEALNQPTRSDSLDTSSPTVNEPALQKLEAPAVKLSGENLVQNLATLHSSIINYLTALNKNNLATYSFVKERQKQQDAVAVSIRQKTSQLERDFNALDKRIDWIEDKFENLRAQKKPDNLIPDDDDRPATTQDATKVKPGSGLVAGIEGGIIGESLIKLGTALLSSPAFIAGISALAIIEIGKYLGFKDRTVGPYSPQKDIDDANENLGVQRSTDKLTDAQQKQLDEIKAWQDKQRQATPIKPETPVTPQTQTPVTTHRDMFGNQEEAPPTPTIPQPQSPPTGDRAGGAMVQQNEVVPQAGITSTFGPPDLNRNQTMSPADLIAQMAAITGGGSKFGGGGGSTESWMGGGVGPASTTDWLQNRGRAIGDSNRDSNRGPTRSGNAPGIGIPEPTIGQIDRSSFQEAVMNDPALIRRLASMVQGEVGLRSNVRTQRAILEEAFNRWYVREQPVGADLHPAGVGGYRYGGYYAMDTFRPVTDAEVEAFTKNVLNPVMAGSNVAKGMTGNASNDPRHNNMVAQHQFQRGTPGLWMDLGTGNQVDLPPNYSGGRAEALFMEGPFKRKLPVIDPNKDKQQDAQKITVPLDPSKVSGATPTKPTHYEAVPGSEMASHIGPDGHVNLKPWMMKMPGGDGLKIFYDALSPANKKAFDNGTLNIHDLTTDEYNRLKAVDKDGQLSKNLRPVSAGMLPPSLFPTATSMMEDVRGIGSAAKAAFDAWLDNPWLQKSPNRQVQNRWDDPAFGSVPDTRFSPMGGMITGQQTTESVPHLQTQRFWGATGQAPASGAAIHPSIRFIDSQGRPSATSPSPAKIIENQTTHPGFGDYSHPDTSVFPAPPPSNKPGMTTGKAVAPPVPHVDAQHQYDEARNSNARPKTQITIPRHDPEQMEDAPGSRGYGQVRDPDRVGICSF